MWQRQSARSQRMPRCGQHLSLSMRVQDDQGHLHKEAAHEHDSVVIYAHGVSHLTEPPATVHDEVGEEGVHHTLDGHVDDEGEELQMMQ